MKTSYFYLISKNYTICDLEFCKESERTIDISIFDLANNEDLLNKLNLYYIVGNMGMNYTYESRAKWFCVYLSSLSSNEDKENISKKLLTNPTIRILLLN